MPTYEYECGACGHSFDEFQQISDKPLRTCPKCGKRKLQRLIGAGAAVIFKGNGFYQTDYRSKEYNDKAKADTSKSSPTSDTTKKESSSSDKTASSAKKSAPGKKATQSGD